MQYDINQLREAARGIAAQYGIRPELYESLITAESSWNPRAVSSAGAAGLVQLMPGTARELGVADRFDPIQSLTGGAKYLSQQLKAFGGDERLALAAYNAGPGAVRKYGGVPPYRETQNYVAKVLGGGKRGGATTAATAAPAGQDFDPGAAMESAWSDLPDAASETSKKFLGLSGGEAADAFLAGPSLMRFAGSGQKGAMVNQILSGNALKEVFSGGGSGLIDVKVPEFKPEEKAVFSGVTPSGGKKRYSIVDIGRLIQSHGFRVREHPEFGGVGKHSPNSWHYKGMAIDVTDWRNKKGWREYTRKLGEAKQRIFGSSAEIFHPGNDPKGHGTHVHLALPNGATAQQYEMLRQALKSLS